MIILLDQDNVLADFETAFYSAWAKSGCSFPPIELERRRTFYLSEDYPAEHHDLLHSIYTAPGFFRDLKPMKGAVQAVREMLAQGHTVKICTTPIMKYYNCVLEKYEWVEKHLGFEMTKSMVLTRDKTLVQGDIIIDDKPEISGLVKPTWEHIIYDHPYNRNRSNRRLNWANWRQVLGV